MADNSDASSLVKQVLQQPRISKSQKMKLRKKQREATHYLHNRSLTTNQQEQKQDGPVVAEENNIEGRGVIYWRARALAAESKLDKLRKEVEKHGGVLKGRAESASRCDEKDADSWSMEFYTANVLTSKQDVPGLQETTTTSLLPDEILSTDTKAIEETTERSSPANHEQLIQFPEEPVDELIPSSQSTNPNSMTSISRKPPEQCEYFSHRRTERNLHKTTDLFSHDAHEYSKPAARYKPGHPRHGHCKQCYTAHCFDDRCWNPAKHRATLRKHPQLRDKEREDSFAVDKARAQARAWAAMQEIHTKPMVSYDYVLLSDDSDSEEESEESKDETLAAEDEQRDEHVSTPNYEEYTEQDTMDER